MIFGECKKSLFVVHGSRSGNNSNDDSIISVYNYKSVEILLSKKDSFNIFAEHLVREYSIENLLFLLSYMKIKYEMKLNEKLDFIDRGYIHYIISSMLAVQVQN